MAYVLVQVEPANLGETNYLVEAQNAADYDMQTIIANSEAEAEAYELAQQRADKDLFDNLPKTEAPKIKSMWPYIGAAAGALVLIALISDNK